MPFSSRMSIPALLLAGAALSALPSQGVAAANPSAAQSVTSACSTQYQAAKTAGTLAGKSWRQFLSDCSAGMKADTGATALKQSATAPAKAAKATAAATAMTTSASATGHMTTQQICSAQYQQAKTAGTLGGQKWPQFLKSCSDSIKADNEDTTGAAPAEPTVAAAKATVPTVDAKGKALTPGQVAFRQRIHECSLEWQSDKSAGTLPAGSKWPQFWSSCNTRLKAQG